ncbi:uncharacterized protein LOC126734583 [Anthonomus grandis grandis]|uniref:uncharacterized protein LOC126734583 n=1 Tax=Anthonomus grandis grandis TaxID=2921223 RepID=UPI00216525F8|nr:uncharacterized protein LOC126734583 [Anthonomus grandis grandis]
MIIPLPKAKHEQIRGVRSKRSEILSSTPYKDSLQESTSQNKTSSIKRKLTDSTKQKKKKKMPSKALIISINSNEEDAVCPGCEENYSNSYGGGDWVRCATCKSWWHEICTSCMGQTQFHCDLCN